MQSDKLVLNFLGLTQRAGKLISGFDAVKLGLIHRKLKIIFIASDLSKNTRDKLEFLNRKQKIFVCDLFTADQLTSALGKKRKIVAIADPGFSQAIIKKLNKGV
ncbi:ribosomal protein L7Ae-like RNA K-turn-binding protein [Lactobacillus colini]|uniref:Ribosomal protein L7Ae-like RNA K-turn-binding protein n=1 Tax=Lactobacillus colini TaxID=1819254 RepID=A0ABS4MDI6_9LACO|nr:ribosomal L7Ae/L30e/S12e/Gadd45 family protein [Lactobacillus colini]MBP2057716.1 ribosomal protein L7Ae-like RNA K-turn-binding protein [Lactobacillus colini]